MVYWIWRESKGLRDNMRERGTRREQNWIPSWRQGIFSRPNQIQGLLFKHCRKSSIDSSIKSPFSSHGFTAPPRPSRNKHKVVFKLRRKIFSGLDGHTLQIRMSHNKKFVSLDLPLCFSYNGREKNAITLKQWIKWEKIPFWKTSI